MTASPSKRPRRGDGIEPSPTSTKRQHLSSSHPYDETASNDDADDAPSFELDLSTCPEFFRMDDEMSKLQIDPDKCEEQGDETQMAAISHATSGGNLFLTGKAG